MTLRLRKQLGLADAVSYVTGAIIGSGIFISPTPILVGCGGSVGLALIVWTVTGLVALVEALCTLELGK